MFQVSQLGVCVALLVPLTVVITYYDVLYRRIPNSYVLTTLICGLVINTIDGGWRGALHSLAGCAFAFGLMLLPHIFGEMGAGDVKLFASIGAVIGMDMVLPAFLVALITGGALAVISILRLGTAYESAYRVFLIIAGIFTGRFASGINIPANRKQTIPCGVAITIGSLITLAIFRS